MKRLGNMATQNNQLQGAITETRSAISVDTIALRLDADVAWALCNILSANFLRTKCGTVLELHQVEPLVNLGAAIGAFVDHPNRVFDHLFVDKKDA